MVCWLLSADGAKLGSWLFKVMDRWEEDNNSYMGGEARGQEEG